MDELLGAFTPAERAHLDELLSRFVEHARRQ
jgi:hypothetical protein